MSRTVRLRTLATLLVSALAVMLALGAAAPARASCARTSGSPYQFTGVVLGTEQAQRVAYVATDDGRSVVVRGTVSTAADVFIAYDRTYVTGHRYVFHPVNGTSPYEDNICTATLDLGPAPTTPPDATRTTSESELADDAGDTVAPRFWLMLGAIAGVALLVTGVILVRRTRATPEHAPSLDDPT